MKLSSLLRLALLALVLPLITAGSCSQANTKPELPAIGPPAHTITEKLVFVHIPDYLTEPCPIAEGPLADAPLVARQRRKALEDCNAHLMQIRGIEGTPAVPAKPAGKAP